MTPPLDPSAAVAARLQAAARDLMSLHAEPALAPYREAAVGAALPFLPLPASLAAAASTLEQAARVLRHRADVSSTLPPEPGA